MWLKNDVVKGVFSPGGPGTHGKFLIRRQRGHPGVVLRLVMYDSANHYEGMQLDLSPIRMTQSK